MKKLLISISIILLFMQGCSSEKKELAESNEINVTVETAERREYQPTVQYTGTFYPYKEANLGAALPGRVEKIYIEEGNYVKEGTLLAELSGELLTQAQVEYETLKKDFERVSKLADKGSLPDQKFDHVKAQFEASQAKTALLKKNTEIRAPFSGTVVEHMINEGESFGLNPGLKPGYSHASGIIRLMKLNPLILKIDVNERDISRIKKGHTAIITTDAYGDKSFEGVISKIGTIFSTTTHSTTVEIRVNNNERFLKPGMFAHATISLPTTESIFIPRDVIIHQAGTGERYVYQVVSGIAKRQTVYPLMELNRYVAVEGLEDGSMIIAGGKVKVKNGSKVRIQAQDPSTENRNYENGGVK